MGIRIDDETLSFFDPSSRELLRVRPNPLTSEEVRRLRGLRPAGPPPRPGIEPVRVQRRVSAVGTVMVCRQTVSLGRPYAGQTVTVHVSDTTITVDLDGQIRVIRRTTDVRRACAPAAWSPRNGTGLSASSPYAATRRPTVRSSGSCGPG